jgi:hypothetical protein
VFYSPLRAETARLADSGTDRQLVMILTSFGARRSTVFVLVGVRAIFWALLGGNTRLIVFHSSSGAEAARLAHFGADQRFVVVVTRRGTGRSTLTVLVAIWAARCCCCGAVFR